jgi:hypothetical protein
MNWPNLARITAHKRASVLWTRLAASQRRSKNCNGCFIVGVEKGDVTDISACTRHKSDDPDDKEDD